MVESFCLEGRAEDFMKFYRIGRYQSIFIDRNCGEGPTTSEAKGRKNRRTDPRFLGSCPGK